jgi:hypothetical protein
MAPRSTRRSAQSMLQPQVLRHRGEVPGVDREAVDRGLAADGVEPRAVQEGRPQRMPGQRRIRYARAPRDAAASRACFHPQFGKLDISAAIVASTPATLSSMTRHSAGAVSICRAVNRNRSGSGLPQATWLAQKTYGSK